MTEHDDELQQCADAIFAAAAALTREFDTAARGLGLTKQQAVVLRTLDSPRAVGELAEQTGVDPSNLSSVLRRLDDARLVTTGPDPSDRRARIVRRTAAGTRTAHRFEEALRGATVLGLLDRSSRAELVAALHLIIDRRREPHSGPACQDGRGGGR